MEMLTGEPDVESCEDSDNRFNSKSVSHSNKRSPKNELKLLNGEQHQQQQHKRSKGVSCTSPTQSPRSQLKQLERKLKEQRDRNERLQGHMRKLIGQKRDLLRTLKRSEERYHALECEFAAFRDFKMREIRRLYKELDAANKEYCQVMSERDTMNKDMQALEERMLKVEETSNADYHVPNGENQNEDSKTNEKLPGADDENDVNLREQLVVCKKRLEFTMTERERVVNERESIRALCGELRAQRDKAISELAEAIRDADEMKKLRVSDLKQIEFLEEKLYECQQRLLPLEQSFHGNEPDFDEDDDDECLIRDYQSLSDSLENTGKKKQTKILKIDIEMESDNKNSLVEENGLGIEFIFNPVKDELVKAKKCDIEIEDEEVGELGEIFVCHVYENSAAFGKLKDHDQILKINQFNVELTNVKKFDQIINNLSRNVNQFIVRRKSSGSRSRVGMAKQNGKESKGSSFESTTISDVSYLELLRKYQTGQLESNGEDEPDADDDQDRHENAVENRIRQSTVPCQQIKQAAMFPESFDSIGSGSTRTSKLPNNKHKKLNKLK